MEEHVPDVSAYFNQLGVVTHMYASQWFLTLFVAKVGLYGSFLPSVSLN